MSSSESNVFDVRLNLRGKKGGGFREAIELMFEDDDITKRLFRIGMYRVIDVLEDLSTIIILIRTKLQFGHCKK
ncbi:hypothetical protein ABKV19_027098 [Rosa sericea]